MEESEFMRTWQVDWSLGNSSHAQPGDAQVSIYPDPGGHRGGVIIRYTGFEGYPTIQNGHCVSEDDSVYVVAMMSKHFKIAFFRKDNRLVAKIFPTGASVSEISVEEVWKARPI